jgi:hypothetical protein
MASGITQRVISYERLFNAEGIQRFDVTDELSELRNIEASNAGFAQ